MKHTSLINLVCLTDPVHTHIHMCARAFSLLAGFHLLCQNVCFCVDVVPAALPPAAKSKPCANRFFSHLTLFPAAAAPLNLRRIHHIKGASAVFTWHFKINTLITGYSSMRRNRQHHSTALTQQLATLERQRKGCGVGPTQLQESCPTKSCCTISSDALKSARMWDYCRYLQKNCSALYSSLGSGKSYFATSP